ncbi:MAG: hypothetical protein U0807_16500 [Candidatus Binatia bacterium]
MPASAAPSRIDVTCEAPGGGTGAGERCSAVGFASADRGATRNHLAAPGTQVTSRVKAVLKRVAGTHERRAVLRLKLNRTGRRLLAATDPLPVLVDVTVQHGGRSRFLAAVVEVSRKRR